MDVPKTLDHSSIEEQDLVSRYVGQKLSPEEAEAFEEHYFGCDQCWAEVQAATEVRAALRPEGDLPKETPVPAATSRVIRGPWRNFTYLAAAAAIALVAAGILVKSRRSPVEELIEASKQMNARPFAARLAGPFPYRPVEKVFRGPSEQVLPIDLRRAALDAQKTAQDRPSAETLRAAGVGHLLLGELDEGITKLEEARTRNPNDVALQNDLAAAYFTRSQQERSSAGRRSVDDLERALKAVDDALRIDPRPAPTLFNRALILERLNSREAAQAAWKAYLDVETDQAWRLEAKKHSGVPPSDSELWERQRRLLEHASSDDFEAIAKVVSRFPQESRLWVEDEVLPAWGQAVLADDRSAAFASLQRARSIGAALQKRSGDCLLSDSINAIDQGSSSNRPGQIDDLARGHLLYGTARRSYRSLAIPAASAEFANARDHLTRAGSPFAGAALLGEAACDLYQNDLRSGLEKAERVLASEAPDAPRHASLVAHAHWSRGFALGLLGYPHEALDEEGQALALFERLEEKENSAAIHGLLSEDLQYVGDEDSSWLHLDRALALFDELGSIPRRTVWIAAAARAHSSAGHNQLSLVLQEVLVSEAERGGQPDTIADALLSSAAAYYRAGNRPRAQDELVRARSALARIPDDDVRRRVEANLDLSETAFGTQSHSASSVERLSAALDFFGSTNNHLKEAQLYLERGKLRVAERDLLGARSDFERGIDELERQRERLQTDEMRIQYFDTGRELYEAEVRLLASGGDVDTSFLYADRAHGRALLDDLGGRDGRRALKTGTASGLASSDIGSLVPAQTALVEYFLLPDHLIAWVVRNGHVEVARTAVGREKVAGLARDLERRHEDAAASRANLTALYGLLIAPLGALIDAFPHLIFVPDRDLNGIPFSALWDAKSGTYLVERHDITIAPSAAAYLELSSRAPLIPREPSVLAVAAPASAPLPGLRPLEQVDEECRRISRLYRRSLVLTGDLATKNAFKDLAPGYSIVHFAGHAISNAMRPGLSLLVFSRDKQTRDSGYLYSHELRSINWKTRVVVLSACSTAAGRQSASEGNLGLAWSFLSVGVPAVVATLWPLEDETALLLTRFHRELQHGLGCAAALRVAQLEFLSYPRAHTSVGWASIQVYGASPEQEGGKR